jgi:hypothetical protein
MSMFAIGALLDLHRRKGDLRKCRQLVAELTPPPRLPLSSLEGGSILGSNAVSGVESSGRSNVSSAGTGGRSGWGSSANEVILNTFIAALAEAGSAPIYVSSISTTGGCQRLQTLLQQDKQAGPLQPAAQQEKAFLFVEALELARVGMRKDFRVMPSAASFNPLLSAAVNMNREAAELALSALVPPPPSPVQGEEEEEDGDVEAPAPAPAARGGGAVGVEMRLVLKVFDAMQKLSTSSSPRDLRQGEEIRGDLIPDVVGAVTTPATPRTISTLLVALTRKGRVVSDHGSIAT